MQFSTIVDEARRYQRYHSSHEYMPPLLLFTWTWWALRHFLLVTTHKR